jgi:hypothetical protein
MMDLCWRRALTMAFITMWSFVCLFGHGQAWKILGSRIVGVAILSAQRVVTSGFRRISLGHVSFLQLYPLVEADEIGTLIFCLAHVNAHVNAHDNDGLKPLLPQSIFLTEQ